MEKDLSNQEQDSYSVNIQGNINGVQIQQGTTNSSQFQNVNHCLLYTSPSPRDPKTSRMPSSA